MKKEKNIWWDCKKKELLAAEKMFWHYLVAQFKKERKNRWIRGMVAM